MDAVELKFLVRRVLHPDASRDRVKLREGGVDESHLCSGEGVEAGDLKRLSLGVIVRVGRGETGELRLADVYSVRLIADVGGAVSVLSAYRQGGNAEITGAVHRVLDRRRVKRQTVLLRSYDVRAERRIAKAHTEIIKVGVRHVRAVVEVEKIPCRAHLEYVARRRRVELEDFLFAVENYRHY